ncbi:hypothetical protein J132_08782 [Termitomyces sp. J132]|nr:hypothetical protein J132_08782 [Termitomyces sp. J132]
MQRAPEVRGLWEHLMQWEVQPMVEAEEQGMALEGGSLGAELEAVRQREDWLVNEAALGCTVMTRSLDPDTAPSPPLQCSAKLPNPHPPSAPTLGNSDTSSADPDGSLINSDAFSAAVDASPEFPWTPKAFPDPRTICFPTDPIRMSLRPVLRLHLTTVDSVQFCQAAAISSALQSRPVVGI